jgi:hypothetical protein
MRRKFTIIEDKNCLRGEKVQANIIEKEQIQQGSN